MLRPSFGVAATLLLPLVAASPAGQSDNASIPIRIVVTDARGRHVTGLSAKDVAVYAGTRQQAVQTFAQVRGPRTFGILLDDYHVSAAAAERAAAGLLHFVDRQLRPEDIVYVTQPPDPASSIAPVRREELRGIISRFAGRKGNYAPQNAFESEYLSAAPPTAVRQRGQIVRAAMQALATALSSRPDAAGSSDASERPKAMIVVTEGFAPEDRGRERLATLRTVARAARLGNVAVYVLDPSAAQNTQAAFGEPWQLLATETGGVLSTSGVPLTSSLAQLSADLDASYLLTIPQPAAEDGAYHRLDITVKRRDAAVRAPTGYWAPIAAERLTPPSRPSMSDYLKTPHVTGLIQPWFRMSKADGRRTRVTFSWAPKPVRAPGASVAVSAITFEGTKLLEGEIRPQGTTGGETRAVFDAAPGPIQVSLAISDANGKLIGTDVRYIDVPALDTAGATIAAVEIVRTRTLREFLERQLVADVMPAEADEFDHRDRLIVRVRTFSQADDAPRVTARLLNPLGHAIRELTPLPDIEGVPQFDLPLASYARGDYRIEVRVTSGNSSTSQLVMFRLIG